MIKICFVCSGNTCRSIMAERLMKKMLKCKKIDDVKVSSKGLFTKGENIADNAKVVLKEHKALASNRKAVQLKKVDKETLYVVMRDGMEQYINAPKVIKMASLIGKDVNDPFGQSLDVYRQTAREIITGIEVLIQNIIKWREK